MISQKDIKEMLYKSLKELNLTEHEINLYTLSLSLGPAKISTIAESLNMPRPNVYKIIDSLEGHGLAKFPRNKGYAKTFMAEPPSTLKDLIKKKREKLGDLDREITGAMPDLLAMYHQGETPTKIKVLEGKEQWLKVFWQILDETKEKIEFFGSADAFIELVSWEEERRWIKKRVQKGIHINTLLTPGKDAGTLQENDLKEMRTTRLFKGAIPFVTGFMLYANKVIIWQPKAPLALLIEDEYIIQMLRSIFDVMWGKYEI